MKLKLCCYRAPDTTRQGLTRHENHKLFLAKLDALDEKKTLGAPKVIMLSSPFITSIQQKGFIEFILSWRQDACNKEANHYLS